MSKITEEVFEVGPLAWVTAKKLTYDDGTTVYRVHEAGQEIIVEDRDQHKARQRMSDALADALKGDPRVWANTGGPGGATILPSGSRYTGD